MDLVPEDRFITGRLTVGQAHSHVTFAMSRSDIPCSHSKSVLFFVAPGPSLVLPQVNELISCFTDRLTSERACAPPIFSCEFQPDLIERIALLIIAPISSIFPF